MEALLMQIRAFDEVHNQTSRSRQCAERVEKFVSALQGYLKGVSPLLQQAGPITSTIIGGVNLMLDVSLCHSEFMIGANTAY